MCYVNIGCIAVSQSYFESEVKRVPGTAVEVTARHSRLHVWWYTKRDAERRAWTVLAVLVAVFVTYAVAPLFFGARPNPSGTSMHPTVEGFGWYRIEKRLPRVGEVVLFHPPYEALEEEDWTFSRKLESWFGVPSIKRVNYIEDGMLIVRADNAGITGEDSDQYGPVPLDAVIGTVVDIYTLRRVKREKTVRGQLLNDLELRFSPVDIHIRNGFVVATNSSELEIYHRDGDGRDELVFRSTDAQFSLSWWRGMPVIYTDSSREQVVAIDPNGNQLTPPDEVKMCYEEIHYIGEETPDGTLAYRDEIAIVEAGDSEYRNVRIPGVHTPLAGTEVETGIEIGGRIFWGQWINQERLEAEYGGSFTLICLSPNPNFPPGGEYQVDVYIRRTTDKSQGSSTP